VVEDSNYSGANEELLHLMGLFEKIKEMKVSNLSVSYIDEGLFERKDKTIKEIDGLVKSEWNNAVRAITRKVLDSYWRDFKTADASTMTEDKVVDALKSQLYQRNQEIK
jgi:hypothetical protein